MSRDVNFSPLSHNPFEDGVKKLLEAVSSANSLRPSNPAANEGESSENHERNGHGPRRFVDVFLDVLVSAAITEEGKEEQTEHVEGGQAGGDEADNPQQEKAVERATKNFIFAEESSEGKNSRDRQGGDRHGVVGVRDLFVEAAHLADGLLAGHGVNHAAGGKEQEPLEEGVSHEVKNSRRQAAPTTPEQHLPTP